MLLFGLTFHLNTCSPLNDEDEHEDELFEDVEGLDESDLDIPEHSPMHILAKRDGSSDEIGQGYRRVTKRRKKMLAEAGGVAQKGGVAVKRKRKLRRVRKMRIRPEEQGQLLSRQEDLDLGGMADGGVATKMFSNNRTEVVEKGRDGRCKCIYVA